MNLKQRLQEIEKLEEFKLPYEIKRVFGPASIFGSQVCFCASAENDYVTLAELQNAINLLVAELGGQVDWLPAKTTGKELQKKAKK